MLTANTRIQSISLTLATPTKIMKFEMPISEKLAWTLYETAFCILESRHLFVSCAHDFFVHILDFMVKKPTVFSHIFIVSEILVIEIS